MISDFYKSKGVERGSPLQQSDRIHFNRFVFENIFRPRMKECESNGRMLVLSETDKKFVEDFAKKKCEAKTKEWKGFDDKNRIKREMTGAYVEYALLKFYKKESAFDDSIVSRSSLKNRPDLLPQQVICDIKGSSINNVPLVFKNTRSYTVDAGKLKGMKYKCVNVIGITDHNSVWILGIASSEVLETFVDDNLIISAMNTSKTGFYGADKLDHIPESWMEFKGICKSKATKISDP